MPVPMRKEICCQNFSGLITYIRKYYGDEGVQNLISDLVEGKYFIQDKYEPSLIIPIKEEHITDPAYWVSNEFSLILLSNVKKIIPGTNPLYTAGVGMIRESLSKTTLFIAKFLKQEIVANRVQKLNARFNKTKDVRLVEIADSSAVFELNYRSGFRVTKDVCNWNLGIYAGIAMLTGATNVKSSETQCILDGAPCCRFKITWEKRNLLTYFFKSLTDQLISWKTKDLIADYENTIEERDRLIEKLVRSENKYRILFEDSFEAMSLSHKGKLMDVNPAWLKLHGFLEKSEIIGKSIFDFVHPDDRSILRNHYREWPQEHERMIQLRDITKNGDIIDVEVYSSRIEYDGNASILATARNITELKKIKKKRRQLETKIQRAEKMEAVATMAGGVAHDLNNILSGIVGYPDLILMQLPEKSPLIKPIRTMQETGKKAAAIVEDLLTLTRRGIPSENVLNLNKIISDYIESPEYSHLQSFHHNVEIAFELAPDLLNLRGSAIHLSKTVMNLVSNAAEAIPDGGTIVVKTANQYIDKALQGFDKVPQGEYCVLTVTDTGMGILDADKEKIFEPFYTKKKMGRSGSGLGMAVIWGTVKDHKGFIQLDSEVEKGTEIRLFFPATRDNLTLEQTNQDLEKLRGKGEKILIVDDIKEQRDIALEMLESLGYNALAVESGEQAVNIIRNMDFDLLVLDMIMEPGIDGFETYRRILKERPGQKAIIASGFSETDRVREMQNIGAGQYLKKPYTLEKIGLAVQKELFK
jgi:PAS domain S-box-containing protein